tara:strand:- start:1438 stop:1845 length:408 start_codon:yes stop_codon:yes gene_type:complete
MQNQDTELTETDHETDPDPFACLSSQIYISGQLTLVRTPAGVCGDWLCLDDHEGTSVWYRHLDSCAFVWLRDAVKSAIKSGKISKAFTDALASLEWIEDIGIRNGLFTADQIADHVHAPRDWQFNRGCPTWALDY